MFIHLWKILWILWNWEPSQSADADFPAAPHEAGWERAGHGHVPVRAPGHTSKASVLSSQNHEKKKREKEKKIQSNQNNNYSDWYPARPIKATTACGMYVIYICDGRNGRCFMPLLDDLLRISQRAMVIFSFSIS